MGSSIYALAGNDVIATSQGNDVVFGGAGTDQINYAASFYPVYVYLNNSITYIPGGNKNDQLYEIENIMGSPFDDVIVGSNGNNEMNGGSGNDQFYRGGTGNKVIVGGSNNDTMIYWPETVGWVARLNESKAYPADLSALDSITGTLNVFGSN